MLNAYPSLNEVYKINEHTTLYEEKGTYGQWPIIGRVEGPHFVPGGDSRNGRHYEEELWQNVLKDPDVEALLERKLMFGTIGHAKDWDVEKYLREGLVSHITTRIWIDPSTNMGMAEDIILDTKAGRALFNSMKAGSAFFTSSRAYGEFKEGVMHNGLKVVDPNKFKLEGFDFVVNPGFLEASPSLMESVERLGVSSSVNYTIEKNGQGGKETMDKTNEALQTENTDLEKGLSESLEANKTLKETVAKFEKIGTPDEISKAFSLAEGLIFKYNQIGTPDKISEALENAIRIIKAYKEIGSVSEINEALKRASFTLKRICEYKQLGSPEDIDEALDKAISLATSIKRKRMEEAATDLAKNYKVPLTAVKGMLEKMEVSEVESTLKAMNEGRIFEDKEDDEKEKKDKEDDDKEYGKEDDDDEYDADGNKVDKKDKDGEEEDVFEHLVQYDNTKSIPINE